ncbi:sensor histidine kinase [Aquihabitans sp. McL0605]|uniref:sensor histidine kinase n=1 Tax=Aquihabitans sp. McL0605 TaxID=3415671 RepID=UPI003CE990DB
MSLRARLLLGMAVVAVVLVIASLSINRATERNLVAQIDKQLDRSADQARIGRYGDRGYNGYNGSDDGRGPPTALYVASIDPQTGRLVTLNVPTTSDDDLGTPSITAAEVTDHVGEGAFTVGATSSGVRYRALARAEGPGRRVTLFAQPLYEVDESINRLLTIQAIAAAIILATLGLVTFWVLRLGVRPVKQMTDVAKAIGDGDLSQRIPETVPGTEAGELGIALNHMMGRIEYAFDERARSEGRLRQFVADASHELRTPVTTIRGYAELYRLGGLQTDHDLDEAMRRTEQEATRMGQLVSDLLDLARLDQGRPLSMGPVDLSALAADAVADAKAVEPARPIELDAPEPAVVVGDEAHLRQILANLVANARVHTDVGTPVRVAVRGDTDQVVLEVADRGDGMAPEVAAHAFERFYRADPARTRNRGGSGLGLSIVAGTVAAHGGSIALETAPGQGTTIRITLPRTPATPLPA